MAVIAETYRRAQPVAGQIAERVYTAARRQVAYVRDVPLTPRRVTPVEEPIYDMLTLQQSARRFWNSFTEKAQLLSEDHASHRDIKTALIVGGGGMAGVVTAGMLEVFRERNMLNTFDLVVGLSAGAANAACALGASERAGVQTYTDMLAPSPDFIKHGLRRPGAMHLEVLGDFLRGDDGIKETVLKDARPQLVIGVVNAQGERMLFDAKSQTQDQRVNLVLGSCAAPYVYNGPIFFNDMPVADGFLPGFPLAELIEHGYNNIMVMMSQPLEEVLSRKPFSLAKRTWLKAHTRKYPQEIVEATLRLNETIRDSLRPLFTNPDINFSILAPEAHDVDVITTNVTTLKQAGMEGRRVATNHFELFAA